MSPCILSGRSAVLTLVGVLYGFQASFLPKAQAQGAAPPPVNAAPVPKLTAPTARDAVVSRQISRLMPSSHVSGKPLDDEISRRALELFLNSFDPLKLYFLQNDVDQIHRYDNFIDDQVRAGDLNPAFAIFRIFTQRVDQRVADAMTMLDGDFDFTIDEDIIIDGERAQYAKNVEEARDRWRKQIKFALLDLKDEGKTIEEAKEQLRRRYARYARRWKQTSNDDLLETFLTSVTTAYDPHSTYMSPASLEDFQIIMRLNLDGIGAALREKDGLTTITDVIPGGAADLDGKLKADDVIVSVGQGKTGEMVDILEMPLKDVVKLIRGHAGTTVRIGVRPGGKGNTEIYEIVRARVELEDSAARSQIIEHELPGQPGTLKIGYINLPSFYMDMESARRNATDYRSSTRDVDKILSEFREQNVAGVILDLSRNGGGSLTEAISLTGLFIDQGPVVQVKNSNRTVEQYSDEVRGTSWDGPLVVLCSKFSASASEIFAGAIKDYHRGIVIGDPSSHGKGTVQTLTDIGQALFRNNQQNYGALKVTLQQFYLPDGQSTQRKGVEADVILPSMTAKLPVAEGDLKYALEHDTVKPAPHAIYNMTPGDLINRLRVSSMARVQADKEFADLIRKIELYVSQKDEHTLSLNEEKFMKRRAEFDSQKEQEDLAEEEEAADRSVVFVDNYYNREAMNVAHEYITGLRAQNLAKAN